MTSGSIVPPRPKCLVKLLDIDDKRIPEIPPEYAGLRADEDDIYWIPLGTCLAHFDCATFVHVLRQHIAHPERNSSNILRADIVEENHEEGCGSNVSSKIIINRIIRPRRPNLDGVLHQTCTIYQMTGGDAIVVYTPQTEDGSRSIEAQDIPFYHPRVRAIAISYKSRSALSEKEDACEGDLYIHVVPFPCDFDFNASKQRSHRLSRTSLALLDTISQHSWGHKHNYQKRVVHDTLVSREEYMDLYLVLKERHANNTISRWVESTKAAKHVFEDIGIAAFLILLWKETDLATGRKVTSFVDVGCGNGLLVYLLNAEGYEGFGFDLQPRKSWAVWRELPGGADLRTISMDAPAMVQDSRKLFPAGSFLIGNHADELTSWIPLLSHAVPDCYGFLNIPCCLFQLDGQHYSNSKYVFTEADLAQILGRSKESKAFTSTFQEFERGPPKQGLTVSTTRNVTYLRYLSHLHLQAGWHLEKEALRIPSTKNWAFIGRRRIWQHPLNDVDDQIDYVTASRLQNSVDNWVETKAIENSIRWKARLPPAKGSSSH